MALVYVDKDPWLGEHDACERNYREIMELFTTRSRERRTSNEYARLSSKIRLRMKQYSSEVYQLKEKLSVSSSLGSITFEEAERRTRLVEQLQSREIQMQQAFQNKDEAAARDRSALIKPSVFAEAGTTGWGTDEEEILSVPAPGVTVTDMRQQQQEILRDQEAGLEELSKVISRQKAIATTINSEVDFQNDLIDDIAQHADNTDAQLNSRTAQIRTISQKDRTCVYWVIIILLFIAIIVVAVV
ncbi:hypothetical protein R5R35_005805 [Gryllus longicercus]|uniref:t-SNARE coiled-coil homology domain-containing protein n=1 Tax=Gryllus longicercus TaxID=2509291 RepID=A0AAN9ZI70_9ORTH